MREKKMNPWWMAVLVVCVAAVVVPALAQEGEVALAYPLADGQVAPEYPPAALAVRFSGAVTVAAHVDAYGLVSEVEILDCTHTKVGFEEAAAAAMEQWRFEPARLGGEAVESVVLYRLGFDMPQGRINQDYPGTTGQFLASGVVPLGVSARETAHSMAADYTTNSTRRRLVLTTPHLPPSCIGCMYDRRHLLPAQHRGGGGQAYQK